MRIQRIEAEATTEAAPDAVWSLLGDRSTWPSWSPLGSHTGERPGEDGMPDGLGGIARFVTGRHRVREEIVEREPARRLSYTLLSGLPLRDYRAVVDLTPVGAGPASGGARRSSRSAPARAGSTGSRWGGCSAAWSPVSPKRRGIGTAPKEVARIDHDSGLSGVGSSRFRGPALA